ncbi:uncharacterized protein BDW43DRAFT_280018 [Aspergillus alliaceus]|uniref:uncharacterized protein n=1 Tax=Petromyces alliaceus TaxID=209559 RepID=UPI0012A661AD|nr:uncharacterized protein BDW43DRAFT_280018 [Aspergillus alliaceus]KAB8232316.1 hypothetical protein BDW43DRAFT_280018 [Aspergillus alliaceus]
MLTNDKPAIQAAPDPQECSLQNPKFQQFQEDRFRFTPVKVLKPAPRIWDRQPSTPFLARPRSRKVWKRFRSSFNSMKALQQLIASQGGLDDRDNLYTEINTSRNEDYIRGVKRQCLGHDSEDELEVKASRGRSFLETKWESEASGRRRKYPAYNGLVDVSEPMIDEGSSGNNMTYEHTHDTATSREEILPNPVERDESLIVNPNSPTRLATTAAYPRTLHVSPSGMDGTTPDIKGADDIDQPQDNLLYPISPEAGHPAGVEEQGYDATLDATMRDDLQSGQFESRTSTTVSSDDVLQETDVTEPPATAPVQVLTAEQESTLVRSALRSSLDGEDAALLNNFLSKAKAKREAKAAAAASSAMVTPDVEEKADPEVLEIPDIPTPQGRRVLEDLDANSPSPQKAQLSPSKVPGKDIDADEVQLPSSPRRSTRTRSVKSTPRTTTTTTAARNTLTLRRAKGTEFVFLKRTEAQELALTTRRNTRQNKGDAMLPKYMLQTLAHQSSDSESPSDDDKSAGDPGRRRASAKRVSWNDDRLVEYEGERGVGSSDEVTSQGGKSKTSEKRRAASSRTTRSQGSSKTDGGDTVPIASTTAATTATPRARRVRRLGTPKPTAAVDASASPSTRMSPPETRKKLAPKSPRTALAGSSASKKVSSVSTRSDTRASSDSSSMKSSSLFKAHAGSTPMPRRVRSRP